MGGFAVIGPQASALIKTVQEQAVEHYPRLDDGTGSLQLAPSPSMWQMNSLSATRSVTCRVPLFEEMPSIGNFRSETDSADPDNVSDDTSDPDEAKQRFAARLQSLYMKGDNMHQPAIKLTMKPVESFSQELPICPSIDEWQNSHFIFLIDLSSQYKKNKSLSDASWRKDDLKRNISDHIKRWECIIPMLAVVLINRPATLPVKDLFGDEQLSSFVEDVREVTYMSKEDKIWYECNFDDEYEVLTCFTSIASSVIRIRTGHHRQTLWEKHEKGSSPVLESTKSTKSSCGGKCCAVS